MSDVASEPRHRWSRYSHECPFEGCGVKSTLASYRARHAAKPHWRCSCGWVGPYWKMHVAGQRRAGNTDEHVQLGAAVRRTEP
jgi:hypothetical protein